MPQILTHDLDQRDRGTPPRFGAVIGDDVHTGSRVTLGAGTAIGRACLIHSHAVIGPTTVIPAHWTIAPDDPPSHRVYPRRT
ncbi:hypothetical protein ACIBSR_03400 [Streptomyces sp. NPDC049936]|uniref:hypothetical protein n=1 Tax=Streptomyces sp. NPDC049936 TaxID=3365599 RepID=UPI00378E7162